MSFYKLSKLTIFIITGILLACSPSKQQNTNPSTNIKPLNTSQGMKVFIDPDTGKFLDSPPVGYVAPVKTNIKNNPANINLNANQDNQSTQQEQHSTTPGGGIYSKMPLPE